MAARVPGNALYGAQERHVDGHIREGNSDSSSRRTRFQENATKAGKYLQQSQTHLRRATMSAYRFLVVLTLAELSGRGRCNWNQFMVQSRGVERPHHLPSYDDGDHNCIIPPFLDIYRDIPHTIRKSPSTIICDGVSHCKRGRSDYDEDIGLCAPSVGVDLQLKKNSSTSSSVQLSWSRPAPSFQYNSMNDKGSGRMKLGGYFLTGLSKRDTVKTNIDYGLLTYNLSGLTAGTTYQIILRPFYVDYGARPILYRIGRASTTSLQTMASGKKCFKSLYIG